MLRTWVGLGLLAACVTACATGGAGARSADSYAELEALKARVLELQRKAAVAEVEIARLRQEVAALQTPRPGEAGRPEPGTSGPPATRESAVAPPAPAPSIEVRDLEDQPAATAPAPSSPVPPTAAEVVPPAAQALYDEAYTLYHQGRYVDAEAAFQRFLQAYPRTDLSDNAVFWIGECRYARGDLKGALAAFRQVLEDYPDTNKVPDALLKAGQCLQMLGDLDGARASYEQLIQRFPGTAASDVAREKLRALH